MLLSKEDFCEQRKQSSQKPRSKDVSYFAEKLERQCD